MDRSAYDRYFELDQAHFWRIAKRRLVLDWTARYALGQTLGSHRLKILDIGGACSLIPKEMGRWGDVLVIEPDPETVRFARERLGLNIREGSFPDRMPVQGQFDLVTMLDVLEHIKEDGEALAAARKLLSEQGLFVCTMPALRWLWSDHDVILHHFRRYEMRELRMKLQMAGLRVVRLSYYTSLLLPLLAAQRLAGVLKTRVTGRHRTEYDVKPPPGPLNALLGTVMSLERWCLRHADCWLGSALIAVCRKA